MMVASSAAKPRMVFITSLVSRSLRLDLLAVMFTTTPRAPDRLTPSSRGQATACSAAMRARSTPEAAAEPIIAMPCSAITVRTSWKSTLMRPGTLMISEIPATAFFSTLSAAENASSIDTSSPSTSSSFSFRITITESTCRDSSSMPTSAACMRRTPSNEKGLVTTATVRMPISWATSATTGAAPVPVPPPIPAVMTAMNSTPATPFRIMWSTALPPAPPTPITLITVPLNVFSTISNMLASFRDEIEKHLPALLKIALKPFAHPSEHLSERAALPRDQAALRLHYAFEQQADARGIARAADHVRKRARVAGDAQPHRHVKNLLAQLDHALHHGRAAREHHSRGQQLLVTGIAQHLLDKRVELLDAGLDHLGERLAGEHPGRAVADARDLDHLAGFGELPERAAVADLELLGFGSRRAQGHCDIVGDLIAGDRYDGRMADRAFAEHRDVARSAADVDQAHAELFFVLGERGERGRKRLQDQIVYLQAAAAHALDDILRGRHGAGDDVHLDLEPYAAHAERLAHAVLAVDDEFLGEDVQHLLVGRDRHRARRFDGALDVDRRHLLVLDRDHPRRVEALDVAAGDPGENALYLAVGHQLSFLERALDRVHRRFDVHDHAFLQAFGLVAAHADDVQAPVGKQFRDHRHHLGGADVQSDDEVLVFPRHVKPACASVSRVRTSEHPERAARSRWGSADRHSRDGGRSCRASAGTPRRISRGDPRRGPCRSRARAAR